MKNKYYTPIISEFYAGFEFEVNNDIVAGTLAIRPPKEWFKQVYGKSEPYTLDFIKYNLDNNLGMIRVKYLDKKDIESLGWGFYAEAITGKGSGKPDLVFKKGNYRLRYVRNGDNIFVEIKDDYVNYIQFSGTIKNLSELKIILKQIGLQNDTEQVL